MEGTTKAKTAGKDVAARRRKSSGMGLCCFPPPMSGSGLCSRNFQGRSELARGKVSRDTVSNRRSPVLYPLHIKKVCVQTGEGCEENWETMRRSYDGWDCGSRGTREDLSAFLSVTSRSYGPGETRQRIIKVLSFRAFVYRMSNCM